MISGPHNLEEARKYSYDQTGINPQGIGFATWKCAAEIAVSDWHYAQCSRKPGYGPDKIFCKQHARMLEKEQP